MRRYRIYPELFGGTGLSTNGRLRSDAADCGFSSVFTLFATHRAALDTSVGSKIDLLKFYNRCGKEILGKCGIIAYQQYNTPKWASARQNLQ